MLKILINQHRTKLLLLSLFITTLTACSGNKTLENLLATSPSPTPTPKPETPATPVIKPNTPTPSNQEVQLPENFPKYILTYPQAKLTEVKTENKIIKTWWESTDPQNTIKDFFQEKILSNNWEIKTPFSQDSENPSQDLIAIQDNSEVKISILSASETTKFLIEYTPNQSEISPETNPTQQPSPTPTDSANNPVNFSDLDQVSEPLRPYVKDLANLGILTPENSATESIFNPNKSISRRLYARWLLSTNNKLYSDRPSQQIRLASNSSTPIFKDVPSSDPDFAIIQGLAEAGIIPSPLTTDPNAISFRPDAPLTREDLVIWKVPLDQRQAIPSASLEAVKETWGFQDAAKIDPKALRSLLADFQNGELSNVRRAFGYTTLFQPKKTVTRAEAAASLWNFGFQTEGVSAAATSNQ